LKFKRVLSCGDMHCGHRTGLTPPKFQSKIRGDNYFDIQRECWDFYAAEIERLKPVDVFINNGDAIEGKGFRSGGTELTYPDRVNQVEIAVACMELSEAKHYISTYGTPYHVGAEDDWEGMITSQLKESGHDADIKGQQWIEINGTTFDIKHKVGASSIPHGRSTPQKKEQLWNLIWSDIGGQPRADIFLRSHVHYFDYSGTSTYLAMTLPALQGQGTKFGSRQCSGVVDFGLVWFDCYEDGSYTWSWSVLRAESQKQEARSL
jgi:hypothetical protein